jgi:glycosyltransferase involved in cell wall biosynthesis
MSSVAIDLTALLPDATGVDTYLTSLVTHLGRVDGTRRYTVFVNYQDRHLFDGRLPSNFTVVPACARPRPARLLFQQLALPAAAAWRGVDVVHSPAFLMPLYRGAQRHVLTVYDLSFFTHPECHIPLRRSRSYLWALITSLRRADLVTVPSQFTRQQILDLVPGVPADRIRVVPPGIGEEFRPQSMHTLPNNSYPSLPSPFILFVGTIEPRKNLERLVESYRRLVTRSRVQEHLVLAGRLGWGYDELLERIAAPELKGRVHLIGYVRQQDLASLFAAARLFVYPSLEEGFGFPPLEAMACGVPTISSSSSSLVENLQGAADLIDPADTDGLANAMQRLLEDESWRSKRSADGLERAARFRWDETARQTIACYDELAALRRLPDVFVGRAASRSGDVAEKLPRRMARQQNDHPRHADERARY